MPGGHPAKKRRNISGLKGQSTHSSAPLADILESAEQVADNCSNIDLEGSSHGDTGDQPHQDMKDQASSEPEDEEDSDFESDHE
ncbi:hypothetical protein CPB84DRAFT_1690403 [Gymnopilus junonius]|uniref:Uncharacterized protein n=1 Tax=Gymnopilus junonius TaxID=109634 RepID=A0A9P5N8R3_GYMJU|nr:hypothetical protein CPB84DRAFT_1690403 [Gymnopilus junonius]